MKLNRNMLERQLASKGNDIAVIHLHGSDNLSISKTKRAIIAQLAGANAEAEMRVEQLSGSMIAKDPYLLSEKFKSIGFFSGPKILVIIDASDNITSILKKSIPEWRTGDSQIIMISNILPSRSTLRQFSENGANFLSLPFYTEVTNRAEIESLINETNLSFSKIEVFEAFVDLGIAYSYHAFLELIEKVSLYKLNHDTPLDFEELEMLSFDSDLANDNELIQNLANGNTSRMMFMINKLYNQGINPIQMVIKANKHFLLLHRISIDPNNFEIIVKTVYPPIFGSRKKDLNQQIRNWSQFKLEKALRILAEADVKSRLSPKVPTIEIVERAFIKICFTFKKKI